LELFSKGGRKNDESNHAVFRVRTSPEKPSGNKQAQSGELAKAMMHCCRIRREICGAGKLLEARIAWSGRGCDFLGLYQLRENGPWPTKSIGGVCLTLYPQLKQDKDFWLVEAITWEAVKN